LWAILRENSKFHTGFRYDIPVVYGLNGNRRGPSHLSYQVAARKACDATPRADPNVVTFAFQENGVFNFGLCLMRHPEDPTKPAVTVTGEESAGSQGWLLPTTVATITVTDASNQSFTLKGGTAAPVPPRHSPGYRCR
jgi:hypothetical protein